MVGNVQEWCLDQYDTDFYSRSPLNNPLAGAHSIDWLINNFTSVKSNEFDLTTYRVLRGSSWFRVPTTLRVASRIWNSPAIAPYECGFRCVRSIP
jgi:formylglycine-generating enzyme required for sulfatase activity